MTHSILRLSAMLLVALSVTSAQADNEDVVTDVSNVSDAYIAKNCKGRRGPYIRDETCKQVASQADNAPTPITSRPVPEITEQVGGVSAHSDATQVNWPSAATTADPNKRPISDLGTAPNKSPWGVACAVMLRDAPSNARLPSDLCGKFDPESFDLKPLDRSIVCKPNIEIENGSIVNGQIYQGNRKTPRLETNRQYQFGANVPVKDRLATVCYLGLWKGLHLTVHQPYKCKNYSYVLSREQVWVATDACATRRRIGINLVSFSKLSEEMQSDGPFLTAYKDGDTKTISQVFGKRLHIEAKDGAFVDRPYQVRFTLVKGSEEIPLNSEPSINGQVFVNIDASYDEYHLKMEVDNQWREVCHVWFLCKGSQKCAGNGIRYFTAVLK